MRKNCAKPVNALRITRWFIPLTIHTLLASQNHSGITHDFLHRKSTVTAHCLHTIVRQFNRQINVFIHSMHIAYMFKESLYKRILINNDMWMKWRLNI